MAMVIFLATSLFLFNSVAGILIADIQEKVDISVYFEGDVLTKDILQVQSELADISEVKEVEYVSKERALEKFIEKHKNDPILMESLTEIGENPFVASLNIKAWEVSQYEQISSFLENSSFKDLIAKIDYHQRKPLIDKVFSITSGINRVGVFSSIILGIITILIVFNVTKMAINNSSDEISVMRLVGASNRFIRGPFLIQGIIVGIFATLAVLLMTLGISYGLDSKIKEIIPGISIFRLFLSNFWTIILIQLTVGVGLGAISSIIAIRKYLKV